MKLHSFFRSSAAYRVRIGLNLKGLNYDYVACHLRKGEQRGDQFVALNAHALVPALELNDGTVLAQSLAILEYLDEIHPEPALLPKDALARARVRSLALAIACEIHPLNNLRVLQYLENDLGLDADQRKTWYCHWIHTEFAAVEKRLANEPETGRFCHGADPTLADVCLVPQVANAGRFGCDLSAFPEIERINAECLLLEAFANAAPDNQPDAE
ncbi:MAG: maleylacetoacetate isomerase [Gammaproteobacteria bacterium]